MIRVRVPATSANIGPGFDTLGIAFNLYNEFEFSEEENEVKFYGFKDEFSHKENVDFLKNEYGWGGSYPVIIGTGIDEQHDAKGIHLSRGFGEGVPRMLLNWNQVEKRIGELIKMDRYLNSKEKEHYPEWLEKMEQRRAEIEEKKKAREILSTAPDQKVTVADEELVGKIINVKITDAKTWSLEGEVNDK